MEETLREKLSMLYDKKERQQHFLEKENSKTGIFTDAKPFLCLSGGKKPPCQAFFFTTNYCIFCKSWKKCLLFALNV